MTAPTRLAAVVAVAVLALHLPYLPASLEDLDSINFALGIRQFDVAQHQPHPPGYPLFMLLAKAFKAFSVSEVHALSLVSAISGAIAVLAMAALFRAWTPVAAPAWAANVSVVLASTSPLFWMTAVRPLSDMAGLAAAVAVQAMTVTAASANALGAAAFCAGLAAGVRSQVVWLTLPVLVLVLIQRPAEGRLRAIVTATAAYIAGGLLWGIPLVVLSGGPAAYLGALSSQSTEDFTGVAMLATSPSPRQLARALYYALLAPWAAWPLGLAVVVTAASGLLIMVRRERAALVSLVAAFGPYFAFDLLFQEMVTTRYALPLVVPTAFLAARGLMALPRVVGLSVTGCAAAAGLLLAQPALAAYATTSAPAFRLLADMRASSAAEHFTPPVLAMHRRQELDLRRPVVWAGGLPAIAEHLPAPPKHEWLELVKYWNRGGRAPIWFVADPPRSDLALVDRHAFGRRRMYRWLFAQTGLIGGIRPNVMDWHVIQAPGWYVGEGWSLTPETAGVAKDEGRGPGRAPIQAWIRRLTGPVTLMIGGRNLAAGGAPVPIVVKLDDRTVHEIASPPGFFLEFLRLEPGRLNGEGDYAALAISAGGNDIAIEQFDAQPAGQIVYGFGDGWNELEYNPATGRLWRWTSERAALRLHAAPQALTLRVQGEFETSAPTAHMVLRAGDRVVAEYDLPREFAVDIPVPADSIAGQGETVLTIETDQWYVPAERNWRPTNDRRHLGLRMFTCEIRPAS